METQRKPGYVPNFKASFCVYEAPDNPDVYAFGTLPNPMKRVDMGKLRQVTTLQNGILLMVPKDKIHEYSKIPEGVKVKARWDTTTASTSGTASASVVHDCITAEEIVGTEEQVTVSVRTQISDVAPRIVFKADMYLEPQTVKDLFPVTHRNHN